MVTRARAAGWLLLVGAGVAGCFDAHAVGGGALILDDFESADLFPTDPDFGVWMPYAINDNDPAATSSCGVDMDTQDHTQSQYALVLDMTVSDFPAGDGLQQHGGAGVRTGATMGAVDFTRFQRIAFDIKLGASGPQPLPASALVYLELACSSVPTESGQTPGTLYVSQGVPYQNYWQTTSLTMANFGPPPWLTTPIQGGRDGCLRHVDGIHFAVDAQLADGGVGHGVLHLDNLVLLP